MCVQMEHLTEGGKIHLNTFHKKLARYERIVDEVRSRVEFALQDENSVKEFLTGDVIQLLKSISGFEWKILIMAQYDITLSMEDCLGLFLYNVFFRNL